MTFKIFYVKHYAGYSRAVARETYFLKKSLGNGFDTDRMVKDGFLKIHVQTGRGIEFRVGTEHSG